MINRNSEIDVIDKESENLEKFFPSEEQPKKKRKSGGGLLLRILLIYFPLCSILIAIAMPAFLRCENKAKGSEAKQYVGSMNRAQRAKFAENGAFANSVDALDMGIRTKTNYFDYSVSATETAAFGYGIPHKDYEKEVYFGLFHWNRKIEIRSYVGAVFLIPVGKNEMTIVAILCVAKSPGTAKPANPTNINGKLACGEGTEIVTK